MGASERRANLAAADVERKVEAVVEQSGDDKAAQNAAQQAHAACRNDLQAPTSAHEKPRTLPGFANPRDTSHVNKVERKGVEPSTF